MADPTIFLKPSTMVIPLQFSDSGQIDFRFSRRGTGVYHTLWCYVVDENGGHIQDEQHNDIRILLANEDNINWDVPSSFPNYRFSLPETAAELFDFGTPGTPTNCYVNFALFTYSSSTYSGSSIIGTKWFSNYGNTSIEAPYSGTIKVQPSAKMYPQIRLIITDETKAYKNTGGEYFYLDNDASQTDLSSNGNIKVKINYYSGHEPEPGAVSQDFCQINGQQAPAVFTDNGLNYNRNTTVSGTSIIDAESKTNFRISVTDGQGLNSEYTTSITWANNIPATKFNDLKELSEDDLRYDYRLGTPVPTSLYLAPDWTATEYTTAPVPDDWEYYADIGDNGTGLINQRDILNDQKRQLNLQLFRKYYRYIQEGTWLDDSYIDDNLYYLDANKILNQSSYPKATYTIDVVDINGIKKYAAYEFTLGQRTYVEDPDMFGYVYNTVAGGEVKTPFRKEVIISERSRNLDDPSKSTIKVQTYKNQWEDIFSSLTATTQSLQYASGGYARAANAVNPNGSINVHSLEQTFQSGQFALSGSATQSITWDGSYGIEITDLSNSLIKLRIASNGLAITTDGGTTWNNAITGNGINTNYLLAGQIDASKINILSAAGNYAFSWNENGLNAVLPDYENPETGTQNGDAYVRFNDLGIYGTTEGSIIEAWEDSNPDADVQTRINYIKQHSNFLLTWDGLTLTSTDIDGNVISLNPNVGLEIFNNDTYTPPSSNPWLWNNTKLGGTTFNRDPQGNLYVAGDKIPVITLGEFYNGVNNQYGLLMRNSNGTPTLYTDENGNLTAISITANDITVDQGFLKRLYLENNSRISYLGSNKEDSQIQDNDVLISIGKTKNGDLYGPGKFIVRADGKYFGELAALNYVAAWDDNDEEDYENENTEPAQNAYAILLGEHDNGQSGSSRISYIFSAFKSNTNAAQATRVFDVRNDGTVDIAGNANISGNTSISGTTTIGGSTEIGGTTTLKDNLTLTGLLKVFKRNPSSDNYLYLNGDTGQIGNSNGTWSIDITGYAAFNNANVTGTINATAGNFTGQVSVGTTGNPQVIIDGTNALIKSSNYQDGAGYGWMINSDGDAVFNNITARGAIKTAVFEYAEIQAVGGIFLFRPSSTIKSATIADNGQDLIIEVENAELFAITQNQQYSWCKISNYITDGSKPDAQDVISNNGLTHVYQISDVNLTTNKVTLTGARAFITAVKQEHQSDIDVLTELEGGALVDMGRQDGSTNYGIGINSSDNTVNLPARTISLFETVINPSNTPKVSYIYKDVFGTLPQLPTTQVDDSIYNAYIANKQGIYTDNMYIGDVSQYLAFYTDTSDSNKKKLVIKAEELMFEDNGSYIDVKDAIDAQNQHFWFLTNGTTGYPAGAYITDTDIEDFKTNRTGGYLLARSDGLEFGNGTTKFVDLIANRVGATTGLYLYGSSSSNPDVSLTTDGLVLTKGGIIAGTPNTNNYIYLSTEDYPLKDDSSSEPGITINGYTPTAAGTDGRSIDDPGWREIIGTLLGITADGSLYASNVDINGRINAISGTIGGFIISNSQLYSADHSSPNADTDGIYMGLDRLAFGPLAATWFDNSGSGKIGSWEFNDNNIYRQISDNRRILLGTEGFIVEDNNSKSNNHVLINFGSDEQDYLFIAILDKILLQQGQLSINANGITADSISINNMDIESAINGLQNNINSINDSVGNINDKLNLYDTFITIENNIFTIKRRDSSNASAVEIQDSTINLILANEVITKYNNGLMHTTFGEFENLRMRTGNNEGNLTWIARSNGHLSLKVVS